MLSCQGRGGISNGGRRWNLETEGSGSREEESMVRTSLNWPERCGATGENWSQNTGGA